MECNNILLNIKIQLRFSTISWFILVDNKSVFYYNNGILWNSAKNGENTNGNKNPKHGCNTNK